MQKAAAKVDVTVVFFMVLLCDFIFRDRRKADSLHSAVYHIFFLMRVFFPEITVEDRQDEVAVCQFPECRVSEKMLGEVLNPVDNQ